jgi:hypothetical protein
MPQHLYVNCPDQKCQFHLKPIWLLVANPLQITVDPAVWPEDGRFLFVACPECRHVSAHLQAYEGDPPEGDRSAQQPWLGIFFLCAIPGCRSPAEFLVRMDATVTQTTEPELREKLATGYWTGVSACEHPISTRDVPKDGFLFEWQRGMLRGHNTQHPRWNSLRQPRK